LELVISFAQDINEDAQCEQKEADDALAGLIAAINALVFDGDGVITGKVTLEGRTSGHYGGITVTLCNARGAAIGKPGETLSDGTFELTGVAPGTYRVMASIPGYLSFTWMEVVVPEEPEEAVAIGTTELLGGDLDGNGVVDFADLTTLLANYQNSGDESKGAITGGSVVSFTDLNLLLSNYQKTAQVG